MEPSRYKYKPLGPGQIRLLKLAPGDDADSPLRFDLVTDDLDSYPGPSYEALSYTWGNTAEPCTAFVGTRTAEYFVNITSNLNAALRSLRNRPQAAFLWIDAVCINQDDLQEREAQVELMRRIFSSATRTVVWLGEHDPSTRDAISCIELVKGEAQFIPSMLDPAHGCYVKEPLWTAFAKLLARSWFERVWVYQEIAVSANVDLRCGPFSIVWDDLCA
ncbi:heterokaryon incompatibility protein-domain-containing protein, partial [Cercophora newfieldiana]